MSWSLLPIVPPKIPVVRVRLPRHIRYLPAYFSLLGLFGSDLDSEINLPCQVLEARWLADVLPIG
jgi:hypothetical protein